MHRLSLLLVALALVMTACSGDDAAPPTSAIPASTSTSSTTSSTTTTTTEPPPSTFTAVGSLGPRMRDLIEGFYNHLIDDANPAPDAIPQGLFDHIDGHAVTPGEVETTVHRADLSNGDRVSVVMAGDDVLLVATTGSGPEIVGAMIDGEDPWLGEDDLRRLLVIGSDARVGEDQLRLRADSIHVLSIVTSAQQGSFIGIPRDSWVRGSKITNLLPAGGPEFMVEVVDELTALEMEGYAAVGFEGFLGLMTELGPLAIDLPTEMRSGISWADYPAGPQVLDPQLALRLARIRKGLPRGDFDRSENQGLVMLAAMTMIRDMGIELLPHWVEVFDRFAFTDLDTVELFTFAATAFVVEPEAIVNQVVPGGLGTVGEASVVFLGDGAQAVFADIEDGIVDG